MVEILQLDGMEKKYYFFIYFLKNQIKDKCS